MVSKPDRTEEGLDCSSVISDWLGFLVQWRLCFPGALKELCLNMCVCVYKPTILFTETNSLDFQSLDINRICLLYFLHEGTVKYSYTHHCVYLLLLGNRTRLCDSLLYKSCSRYSQME